MTTIATTTAKKRRITAAQLAFLLRAMMLVRIAAILVAAEHRPDPHHRDEVGRGARTRLGARRVNHELGCQTAGAHAGMQPRGWAGQAMSCAKLPGSMLAMSRSLTCVVDWVDAAVPSDMLAGNPAVLDTRAGGPPAPRVGWATHDSRDGRVHALRLERRVDYPHGRMPGVRTPPDHLSSGRGE